MLTQLRPTLVSTAALMLLTGLVYPLVVTGVAQLAFPHQANGSLLVEHGAARGAALIGQPFDDPRYFWGRLSATSPVPYTSFNADTGTGSTGSNYGPLNPKLIEAAQARIDALHTADPGNKAPIPVDLVTASASGLDPDTSVAAAEYEVSRVARLRELGEDQVRALVQKYTIPRHLGVLGEPRVNILRLNLALDDLAGQTGDNAHRSAAAARGESK
jgi:K+-transporting ATPase ATPase C chain